MLRNQKFLILFKYIGELLHSSDIYLKYLPKIVSFGQAYIKFIIVIILVQYNKYNPRKIRKG